MKDRKRHSLNCKLHSHETSQNKSNIAVPCGFGNSSHLFTVRLLVVNTFPVVNSALTMMPEETFISDVNDELRRGSPEMKVSDTRDTL